MDRRRACLLPLGLALAAPAVLRAGRASAAGEKLKVGVFAVGAALPYVVALKRGYFTELGLDCETVSLATPALIVQTLVTGDIDAAANLVTLEAANINVRRPDTVKFFSLVGQNKQHVFEQFLVRPDSPAKTLADLKGARIFSAPGPANVGAAKAVLAKVGLQDGRDYQMQEAQLGVQLGAMKAGTFDAGYALEPVATTMIKQGVARRLEAGVISTYLLDDPSALAYAAGGVVSGALLKARPSVATRFAQGFYRAMADVKDDPTVRQYLVSDMNTPADIVNDVSLSNFSRTKDLTPKQIDDFQKFIDLGTSIKVVAGAYDVKSMIAPL